jgi:hypothetical protein
LSSALQQAQDILSDEGLLCDKAAVLGTAIKENLVSQRHIISFIEFTKVCLLICCIPRGASWQKKRSYFILIGQNKKIPIRHK